ncbi:MAG: hypothetical protein JXA60_06845 [Candidatus Coatesbacteria bacterium]|nr:hypothetical protein [Candidatus Coatesbacteria bacterium]
MSISLNPWIWIAAILTIAIYSFLYKDNPLYKFAEHLLVGLTIGYLIAIVWFQSFIPKVWVPLNQVAFSLPNGGNLDIFLLDSSLKSQSIKLIFTHNSANLLVLIPTILGILIFAQFTQKYRWLVRFPISFLMGASIGMSIPLIVKENILVQLFGAMTPFFHGEHISSLKELFSGSSPQVFTAAIWISNLLLFIGTVTTIIYFFFSMEHKGIIGKTARVGIWFLMVGFGASFGYTVMARISLLIGRIQFLMMDWLGIH